MKFIITEEQIKERVKELAQEIYDFFYKQYQRILKSES